MGISRRLAWAAAALMLCGTAYADPAASSNFSLLEALGIAYTTNPQLGAAQASLRATDETVAMANAKWRPSISATGTYSYNNLKVGGLGRSVTYPIQGQVGLQQELFRGGRTYAEIGKAKANVRAARAELVASEQTVLLAAATAYMDVVRDAAIVNLRHHNVDVLRRQKDSTALEFKAGSLTRTDVAQAEARLAGAQAALTAAEGQLAISRATFVQVIGRPAETLEERPATPPAVPANEDAAQQSAVHANPALVQAQEYEKAADYAVDEAIGALLPEVNLQGGYQYSQQSYASALGGGGGVTQGVGAQLQVNIPIYQGGGEQAAVRQAKQLRAQAQLNVSVTDRQVHSTVASAWNAYQAALANIESNEATAKSNEIAFTGVSKEQRVGGRTILDVLNAQQELLNAQVAVVTSRRDATVAAFQVLAASGLLTAKNLGLKVTVYDPLAHYEDNAARWVGFGE
ncbi:TolC family outer membrane protein [Rhizomicrobium electricum]|uniref:TolC family outer membrane protein n=1 Tax=Rhizomicrobium electricum TaxID=480070 RepID=A0ABP3Q5U8_9PROT|nr:TolC family outer membrane protein [Rhizomicrobium electricum]NIJ50197.1 TolC family type I secretion outer membrane protein [Rhizomicrobium electricum]